MIKQFNSYGKKKYDLERHNGRFIDINTYVAYEIFEEGYKTALKTIEGKMILKCNCDNEYQDKQYGKNNRVHNKCTKSTITIFKCTVCNAENATFKVSKG